jgi:RNA polymerase sigma-70 factor (ECF subfamily)
LHGNDGTSARRQEADFSVEVHIERIAQRSDSCSVTAQTGAEDQEERVLRTLVDRARQGDEEAFGALVGEVGDRCIFIAHRILRDANLAEDAVQVALVQVWRELPALRDLDRFEAWLHRILVNACYAEARRGRHFAADVVLLETDAPAATDELLTVHDRDQLDRGFRRLPPEQRAVLVFHHALGLTVPEVADHLGIPLGTAKSRLSYATAAIRAALEADARTPTLDQEQLA